MTEFEEEARKNLEEKDTGEENIDAEILRKSDANPLAEEENSEDEVEDFKGSE